MFSWFRTKKEKQTGRRAEPADGHDRNLPLAAKVEELEQKLKLLTEGQAHLQPGARYEIHIDTLNIDKPILESLLFRLDQLDIDELSGSLNLGNNFLSPESLKEQAQKPAEKAAAVRKRKAEGAPQGAEGGGLQSTGQGFKWKIPKR